MYSAGGFASLSATRAIAERALSRSVPSLIVHVGDFDPSGASIFVAMVEDAASFAAEDRVLGPSYQALTGFRIALTAEQVDFYDLPTAPVKATDSRAWRWEGGTCQLEALPPDELHRIIENAIAERIADEALAHVLDDEETDRAELLSLPPANRRRGSDCHEHGPTNPRRRPDGN